MRILRFIVSGQVIELDPSCDFSGLIPGTKGYLQAEFIFSPEWDGCAKVAAFYSPMGIDEYPPQILKDGKTCSIPSEALKKKTFKVQVLGMNKNKNYELTTNRVEVHQNGGN